MPRSQKSSLPEDVAPPGGLAQAAIAWANWDELLGSASLSEERRRKEELVQRALAQLDERDLEILRRFYLHEQSPDQIGAEMSLTETQLRLLKSRAKARFTRRLRKVIDRRLANGEVPARAGGEGLDAPVVLSRMVAVIAHAVAVFGDENKASHWLTTPLPLLGDRPPSELLEHPEGVDAVETILTRIEHNIPS